MSTMKNTDEIETIDYGKSSYSTEEVSDNYSKQSIINVAKSILFKIEPANVDLYQYGHFTNKQIYEQVQKRLPNLHTICSNPQFTHWLAKENVHFGKIITKRERENSLPFKGRPLWLFNEDHLRESDTQFRKHVQKSNNFFTVDYVRKSPRSGCKRRSQI